MPASPQRAYLDANVFIALLQNEDGRADVVQGVLEDARLDRIQVITSVLTITEVAFAAHEIAGVELTPDGEASIDRLWEPASPVKLVDASMASSRKARELVREAKNRQFTLKPYDAQHLAAAALHSATWVFSYENKGTCEKRSGLLGISVEEPWVVQPGML
jgi:predicted nucleic acid-binding protein